jgi:hypothetical protein
MRNPAATIPARIPNPPAGPITRLIEAFLGVFLPISAPFLSILAPFRGATQSTSAQNKGLRSEIGPTPTPLFTVKL